MSVNIVSPGGADMFLNRSRPVGDASGVDRGSKSGGRTDRAEKGVPADIQSDRFDLSARAAADFDLNALALKVRGADQNLGTIEQYVDEMKSELERVVKNYPPFPEGSEERVRMLKSFKALREQIESLMLPPPSDQDDVKLTVDSARIPPEQVVIPELSEGATDDQIYAAIETLSVAKEILEDMRSSMMSDAVDTITFDNRYPGYAEDFRQNMSAEVAQQTSGKVREALAKEAGTSLAGAQSRLFVSVE